MPTAIVTGGALRIGNAFVCHLAEKGFDIALHYNSSAAKAEEAMERIRRNGVRCKGYSCDFNDLAASEGLLRRLADDFQDITLLINSASNFILENIEQTSSNTLVNSINVNLLTPYLLMREYKKIVNRGMIVNIVDERILKNIPTFAAYSVSKVGLAHLTHLAAIEWGATIRVNGIAPGLILPPPWETDDYLKREAGKIPVRKHGSPENLVKGLDYLIENTFVNGEILFIDGGESKSPGYAFLPKS